MGTARLRPTRLGRYMPPPVIYNQSLTHFPSRFLFAFPSRSVASPIASMSVFPMSAGPARRRDVLGVYRGPASRTRPRRRRGPVERAPIHSDVPGGPRLDDHAPGHSSTLVFFAFASRFRHCTHRPAKRSPGRSVAPQPSQNWSPLYTSGVTVMVPTPPRPRSETVWPCSSAGCPAPSRPGAPRAPVGAGTPTHDSDCADLACR